ncbi:MAG: hypothetical protein Q4G49_07500 [Paracoccus sp. (in: a-proteobacteria)]|nr:hypothetical protein [Paracoccus sp. (in: a-proteobacteria)]
MRKNCLPHIKQIGKDWYEFRKRMPKDSGHTGEFKRRIRAKDMAALAQVYAGVLNEYEGVCAGGITRLKIKPPTLPFGKEVLISPKTLADAAELYLTDRLEKSRVVAGTRALNRVRAIMEKATGIPFERFPLSDLRREPARVTRDALSSRVKDNGERISAGKPAIH